MNKYVFALMCGNFLSAWSAPAPSSDHIATIYQAAKNNQLDQMEAALTWKKKQGEKKYLQLDQALKYAIAQQDARTTETLTMRLANEINWVARNPGYATALFTAIITFMVYASAESPRPKNL